MKILKYIQASSKVQVEHCGNCKFFNNHPQQIEQAYNGLITLSSGYGSVRHKDGICNKINRYLSLYDSCPGFSHKTIEEELNKQ